MVVREDLDRSFIHWVPFNNNKSRKGQKPTGKVDFHYHKGLQNYCVLFNNSGVSGRKFMPHSSEQYYLYVNQNGKRQTGLVLILVKSYNYVNQFRKAKKNVKRSWIILIMRRILFTTKKGSRDPTRICARSEIYVKRTSGSMICSLSTYLVKTLIPPSYHILIDE